MKCFIFTLPIFWLQFVFASESPKVNVAQGTLAGTTIITRGGREVFAFLGIPYAATPTGKLRFKSPQPPPAWTGDRDASVEGSACVQQFILIEKLRDTVTGNEDCLYLNVFTPKISQTEKLPVLFYIHGGSYAGASGSKNDYGPELLLDRDVVLVVINYRLGPLGFLSTGDKVLPGNLGLKDQLAALRWVQQNIEQFGGDKHSVTIVGESAGGASVHLHMLSARSKGLFHAAVSQSGVALSPWAHSSPARHKQLAGRLARLLNCTLEPSQELLDCLMALPAEDIVKQGKHFMVWDMDPVVLFNPAIEPDDVEDAFLTSDPWTLSSNVPWMIGFNQNEGALKTISLTQGNVPEKFKRLNREFESILPLSLFYQFTAQNPDQITQAVRQFYFGETERIDLENIPELIKLYTDSYFAYPVVEAVQRHGGPVFVYYFAYNSSFSLCNDYFNNPQYMGVCHFDELLYLFPMEGHAPKLVENDPDFIMSKNMVELWTNFAKNRMPGFDDSDQFWESANGSAEDYLLIAKEGFTLQKHLLTDRMQFWHNLPFREKPQVNKQKVSDEL